ncbi:alpha/beta hydrolase fold/Serine aminopeptidase, S33/Alpha/beta hydrolase family, putative [Angomonas deanei]|uniref:Alpha/beta hydrolase fold/Serine aminopeptidase, S33/Alpha/beta hydrolase family, putative n=1 Tax=Angomonas deanei TaxID=59799 RepID=A0A7G2CQ98_9TRYP|nr:alpha/beta hydrolase fold/Serine aminopeptidase, S33/Alpha/beta hydrolase family, putative [Angomonas deanei]
MSSPATNVPFTAYRLSQPTPEDKFISIGECASTKKEITICYQTHGDPSHPPLLLIPGLESPLYSYNEVFVNLLVQRGFYVVRYDNRDSGCSTHLDGFPTVALPRMILPEWASLGEGAPPYRLEDMANDGLKLIDRLGLTKGGKKVHIFGGSMGGMIVQLMAIQSPQTIASLNILYSHSGGPAVVPQTLAVSAFFLDKPESDSEADQLAYRKREATIFAGDYPIDEAYVEKKYKLLSTRCPFDQEAVVRQMWAIRRAASRVEALQALNPDSTIPGSDTKPVLPVTIIHGLEDTTVPHENGVQLAKLIHHSKLVSFAHMGHSLPVPVLSPIADELALHIKTN